MDLIERYKEKAIGEMRERLQTIAFLEGDSVNFSKHNKIAEGAISKALDELYGCFNLAYYDVVADSRHEDGVKAGWDWAIDEIFINLRKLIEEK